MKRQEKKETVKKVKEAAKEIKQKIDSNIIINEVDIAEVILNKLGIEDKANGKKG